MGTQNIKVKEKNMYIVYRDSIGQVIDYIDDGMNIVFDNGYALFTSNDIDYKVPVSDVLEIGKE